MTTREQMLDAKYAEFMKLNAKYWAEKDTMPKGELYRLEQKIKELSDEVMKEEEV